MNKINYKIGLNRAIFNQKIMIFVFFHYLMEVFKGNLPANRFIKVLKRLLLFLSKMKDNKYVQSGKETKMNLYVPAFPTKAFYKACSKVIVIEPKMRCISVLLSVTSACKFHCSHCYQKLDTGKDVEIEMLTDVVRKLDEMGVAFFNIEGGEPFLVFERLKKVCSAIKTGEIWINSTGDGMTPDKLSALKTLGVKGVMFSLHSANPEKINNFMGKTNAWDKLTKGIELCHLAGLDVAANSCLMREDFYDGTFHDIMNLAKRLGVSMLQLIKPKPAGAWLCSELENFSDEDINYIKELVLNYNNKKEFKDYPMIAAQIADESSETFGCTAGGTDRFYINSKGDIQPCEFLNMSFGNIKDGNFDEVYDKMRKVFEIPGDCWICEKYSQQIGRIYQDNHLQTLPIPPELSAQVYENWDRGKCPDFYDKAVKIK